MTSYTDEPGFCPTCGCANGNHTKAQCAAWDRRGKKKPAVQCTVMWSRCTTRAHANNRYINCVRCPMQPAAAPADFVNLDTVKTADQIHLPRPDPEPGQARAASVNAGSGYTTNSGSQYAAYTTAGSNYVTTNAEPSCTTGTENGFDPGLESSADADVDAGSAVAGSTDPDGDVGVEADADVDVHDGAGDGTYYAQDTTGSYTQAPTTGSFYSQAPTTGPCSTQDITGSYYPQTNARSYYTHSAGQTMAESQPAPTTPSTHIRTAPAGSDPLCWNQERIQQEQDAAAALNNPVDSLAAGLAQVNINREQMDNEAIYVEPYLSKNGTRVCFINIKQAEVRTAWDSWVEGSEWYNGRQHPCFVYTSAASGRRFYKWKMPS